MGICITWRTVVSDSATKICHLTCLIDGVTDTRKRPRIATSVVIRGVLVMLLGRLRGE